VWRYLKSAFFVGVDVPALGRLPVNALAAAGFFILGFGHPSFWFLGLAAEAVVLPSLAFNRRFQNVVDALDAQAEDFLIDTNRDALENLKWVYLKLMIARYHLLTAGTDDTPEALAKKIEALQKDLGNSQETPALRQSKQATLDILKRRLGNVQRREDSLQEVESDLTRVESQVDLILDNAAMQGKPQTISTDIELASDLVGGGMFGESESAVADLDRDYSQVRTAAKTATPEHS